MSPRALVTGAAGFVGSNLCWELAARGWQVVAMDDFSAGTFENLRGFPGDVVAADFGNISYWSSRVGKIDAVFHQAAISDTTVMDQALMMRVNVESFRDLLGWAAKAKVKKVVYASSAGTYGDAPVPQREDAELRPMNVYGFSKCVMETVAANAKGVKAVGLRYFNVFGPREAHKNKSASMIWQLSLQMRAGRRPRIQAAAALGFATPLLPCGPLYFILSLALLSGTALRGVEYMLAFGLGTVPLLWLAQSQFQWIRRKLSPLWLDRLRLTFALATALIIAWRLRGTLGFNGPDVSNFVCCF